MSEITYESRVYNKAFSMSLQFFVLANIPLPDAKTAIAHFTPLAEQFVAQEAQALRMGLCLATEVTPELADRLLLRLGYIKPGSVPVQPVVNPTGEDPQSNT